MEPQWYRYISIISLLSQEQKLTGIEIILIFPEKVNLQFCKERKKLKIRVDSKNKMPRQ